VNQSQLPVARPNPGFGSPVSGCDFPACQERNPLAEARRPGAAHAIIVPLTVQEILEEQIGMKLV
jgi:hypothetical protein